MTLVSGSRAASQSIDQSARPTLIAASHGTSDAAGQRAVAALVESVALHEAATTVIGGFVDVQQPDVETCLDAAGQAAVIVPLLLSAGYHVNVDLAKAAGAALLPIVVTGALGPDRRLARVLAERLEQAGLRNSDSIVLAAAGSSDAAAVADCRTAGEYLAELLGRPVVVAFLSAATPRLSDAVAEERATHPGRRIIVSTYLLAPGYFADLAASAGADLTTLPLLADRQPVHPLLTEIVADLYAVGEAQVTDMFRGPISAFLPR